MDQVVPLVLRVGFGFSGGTAAAAAVAAAAVVAVGAADDDDDGSGWCKELRVLCFRASGVSDEGARGRRGLRRAVAAAGCRSSTAGRRLEWCSGASDRGDGGDGCAAAGGPRGASTQIHATQGVPVPITRSSPSIARTFAGFRLKRPPPSRSRQSFSSASGM